MFAHRVPLVMRSASKNVAGSASPSVIVVAVRSTVVSAMSLSYISNPWGNGTGSNRSAAVCDVIVFL